MATAAAEWPKCPQQSQWLQQRQNNCDVDTAQTLSNPVTIDRLAPDRLRYTNMPRLNSATA